MSGAGPPVEVRDLGRRFGPVWAVRGLTFEVRPGELVGLVGPDGAGKTTLLQLLAAILDPSEGTCRVLGFDTVRQAPQVTSRIGYMAQGFTLYPRLTVAENLAFAARVRSVPRPLFEARRARLLAMAGLAPFLDRPEGALSGGMRKKLALCTSLVHEPPLLLLDEPGLGVDPLSRRELWRMLEEYRRRGTTIVFSTSYMDEAGRCEQVIFLDRGRMIARGSPETLRERARGRVFAVSSDRPSAVEAVLRSRPDVLGIQWRASDVRFVTRPDAAEPPERWKELRGLGRVVPAEPGMEDLFALLGGGEGAAVAPEEPVASVRTPGGEGSGRIVARELTRRFGNFIAVNRVSLTIAPGEIFCLLGANGAGKTTLIRLLCGLLPPSSGSAETAGVDVAEAPHRLRQRIGYMSQRFSLYLDLTVAENLAFFASAYGLPRRRAAETIGRAMAMTGLTGLGDERVDRLSGAVRQRLALACSILHRPSVLFLDEPTSGVDPLARFRYWRLIRSLAEAGVTVLVTTHYLEEAVYCNRVGLMHEGRLIAVGDLATLRGHFPDRALATPEDIFLAFIERERNRAEAVRPAS